MNVLASDLAFELEGSRRHVALAIQQMVVPDVSLIDPETTLSMDPFLSACTGIT